MCLGGLEPRSSEIGNVTPTAHENVGGPLTVRTPCSEDTITAAVERELRKSSGDIARELGLYKPKVLDILHDNQLRPYH
jgi:hypothetical protein